MTNTINITKCDNELILIAYQWSASFSLLRMMSGNSNTIDFNLSIETGPYQGGVIVNGVNHPIAGTHYVYLPSGSYSLVAIGIDWGGPQEFSFSLNGKTHSHAYQDKGEGVVWHSKTPIPLTIS